ncbi:MAG: hypothetical protein JWN44_7080 [Myxococcales bacterium]|nr:hypothetical protein [Myxococcales bacterium]
MKRLILVAAVVVCGCNDNFDPASLVAGLRLLQVKADPPDVAPGEAVTMTATFANPGGSVPAITWDACLLPPPPATGQSVNQDCITLEGGDQLVRLGTGGSIATTMPMIGLESVGLPDQTNGFYLPVRLRLEADGKRLTAFYSLRIFLGALTPNSRNMNPTLMGIYKVPAADAGADAQVMLDDTAPLEVHEKEEVPLRALLTPDATETYVIFDGDPRTTPPRTVDETVRVSWYTTAGTFSNEATGVARPDTTLTLDKHLPAPGSTIDIWTISRDERGGGDALHRRLIFR